MGKLIMTADDSASVRQMVAFTLKQNGYEVIEAVDGQDALTKLSSKKVDMLLTDLNMPKLDGIGLIKGVRASSLNKFIPIVMLTTESQDCKEGRRQVCRCHRLDRQTVQAGTVDRGRQEGAGINEQADSRSLSDTLQVPLTGYKDLDHD